MSSDSDYEVTGLLAIHRPNKDISLISVNVLDNKGSDRQRHLLFLGYITSASTQCNMCVCHCVIKGFTYLLTYPRYIQQVCKIL